MQLVKINICWFLVLSRKIPWIRLISAPSKKTTQLISTKGLVRKDLYSLFRSMIKHHSTICLNFGTGFGVGHQHVSSTPNTAQLNRKHPTTHFPYWCSNFNCCAQFPGGDQYCLFQDAAKTKSICLHLKRRYFQFLHRWILVLHRNL